MSILYISEYTDMVGNTAVEPAVAEQQISFTATAGQSAAFNNRTRFIRVETDGIANIALGLNPTAVAGTNKRVSAGAAEYFVIPQGQSYKLSAVTAGA